MDNGGNAYVAGFTDSLDFPLMNPLRSAITGRTNNSLHIPPVDGFIAKLDPSGSQLLFSTLLGGSNRDECMGIALDAAGNNVYVTGMSESTNSFVPPMNGYQTNLGGGADVFVMKINSDGTTNGGYYATYLGGTNTDFGRSIAVDGSGNAWVTGFTTSTNFPITNALASFINAFNAQIVSNANHMKATNTVTYFTTNIFDHLNQQTNLSSLRDAFISELDPTGTQLLFSTHFGGSNDDDGLSIALDSIGDPFVTGYTRSAAFPTNTVTTNAFDPASATTNPVIDVQFSSSNFLSHVFVVKLTNYSIAYSTEFGGYRSDVGRSIAVDSSGEACVAGSASSTNFGMIQVFYTTNGAFKSLVTTNPAFTDLRTTNSLVKKGRNTNEVFIAVLSPDGSTFVGNKSVLLGGAGNEQANGIAVNAAGDTAYLIGQTTSTNFPTAHAAQPVLGNGKKLSKIADAFVSKIFFGEPPPE